MRSAFNHLKAFGEANGDACDPRTVCAVDDDVSMLRAVDRLLSAEGFNVETFTKPSAFLSTVAKRACRVTILDVWMPEMNGLEVQAALRKHAPEMRVIFLSGQNDPSIRQTALEAGAFGFLSKPFDEELLVRLVRTASAN